MADKRITELTNEKLILGDDDYTIVDSNEGTYKYKLKRIVDAIPAIDDSLSHEGQSADAKAVGDELADVKRDLSDKANTDGTYDGMTVGNAKQLLSEKYLLDEEPYLFRASGGDGADRVEECIVGGSVAWNQLCDSASVTVTNGHKYISKVGSAWTIGASTGSAITGLTSGTDMIIDLTALFGSTIADYIYSLEQATAGAGVAWFKKYFPEDYYEYSAPTLRHVEGVSQKEVVGKNLLDSSKGESGGIDASGNLVDGNNMWRATAFTQVIPSQKYVFSETEGFTNIRIYYYDANENYIGRVEVTNGTEFTTNANARKIKWSLRKDNVTITADMVKKSNIQLELGSTATDYEPYHKNIYPLDSTITLRGIPKLTDGKMWFDGDKYNADGTVQRRYGVYTFTGNENFISTSVGRCYMAVNSIGNVAMPSNRNVKGNIIVNGFTTTDDDHVETNSKQVSVYIGNITFCLTKSSESGNVNDLKTYLQNNPTTFVYELATPTTEEATPYTALQMLDPHGTEKFVTTGIVPVGHYSKYLENLRSKIEGLPRDFSTLIAPTEKEYKATQNYTVGSLLIVDNILYKVTSAIANGGTITPNTNVTATTLAAVIAAL